MEAEYINSILTYDTTKGYEGLVAMFSADELEEMYDFISDTYDISLFEEDRNASIVQLFMEKWLELNLEDFLCEHEYDLIIRFLNVLKMF